MKLEHKCKNCGKEYADHRSNGLNCPKYKKGVLHAYNNMKKFAPVE